MSTDASLASRGEMLVGCVCIDRLLLDLDEEQVLAAPKDRDVAGPWIVDATEVDVVVRKVKDGRDERLAAPPSGFERMNSSAMLTSRLKPGRPAASRFDCAAPS